MDTRNAYSKIAYLVTLVFEVETFGVWPPQIKIGQYAPTAGTLVQYSQRLCTRVVYILFTIILCCPSYPIVTS